MKKFVLGSLIIVSSLILSCNNDMSGDKAILDKPQEVSELEGKQKSVDLDSSKVYWRATHKSGLLPRFGTINITEGTLAIKKNEVTGGSFVLDINTLLTDTACVAEDKSSSKDLDIHLKGSDFFNVEKYPVAKFEITNIISFDSSKLESKIENPTNIVSGNLTIKDSTVNVTFPARITSLEGIIRVEANFSIDRTQWGINYKAEGDPKDWAISRNVDMILDIRTKK